MSSSKRTARRGLIRQGDVLLVPVDDATVARTAPVQRGDVVLAEGEATGHAHRVDDPRATLRAGSGLILLVVTGDEPVRLEHEEHDPLPVSPGAWEVRRQREYPHQPWRTAWVRD